MREKRKRKRYVKLTEQVIENFADLLRKGYTPDNAAALLKVSRTSYYNWRSEGEKLQGFPVDEMTDRQRLLLEFRQETDAALAHYFTSLEKLIFDAAADKEKPTWQAAAWILERRRPEVYGRARREIVKSEPVGTVSNKKLS